MEHLHHTLIARLREEAKDVIEYHRLAKEAEAAGNEWLARKLYAIAKEELTHAYTIRRALRMEDAEIDPETCRMYREAEAVFDD